MAEKARWFQSLEFNKFQCLLCPHACRLAEGEYGKCKVRHVEHFELVTDSYERITSMALDHIEKKPLYHFYPGGSILSIGGFGCNFACPFCQNWQISQEKANTQALPISELARLAKQHGSIGVAFTYNEPTLWYEYIMDVAPILKKQGSKVVLVTNGYIMPDPLEELLPFVDAMNIDLKSSRDTFYRHFCGGMRDHTLETIRRAVGKTHVEITHLIVTGQNDNPEQIEELVDLIASIDPEIPLHFSRYFPQYRYTDHPTSAEFMSWAYEKAKEKMPYVYLGNITMQEGSNSYCPHCGNLLVSRAGHEAVTSGLKGNRCSACDALLKFVNV